MKVLSFLSTVYLFWYSIILGQLEVKKLVFRWFGHTKVTQEQYKAVCFFCKFAGGFVGALELNAILQLVGAYR